MSFMSSMGWIVITFLFFTILVAVIAAVKTRNDDLKSAEGFFLAGRGLPGIVIAGSLLLTNLSAEQLVGTNGQAWATDMSPMGWELGAMLPLLVVGLFLIPMYLKMGVTTIPQLIEARFGRTTKILFSGMFVVMYSVLNLPVILYSGAVVFVDIFDLGSVIPVNRFTLVAILCVVIGIIGGLYALCGGLKAVAVSDTINGIGLLASGMMVPVLALAVLGHETSGGGILEGIQYMVQADPAKLNAWAAWDTPEPSMPWLLFFTGIFFTEIYWWGCNQSFVQRVLGAKSLKDAQQGTILCAILKGVGFLYLALPGVIAAFLPSIQEKIAAAGDSAIDFAYPALITAVIPKPLMGFFAAVLFGAILSSFNSVLNSAATMFSLDLYRTIKPEAPDAKVVKIGQYYGVFAGVVSVVIAPFVMYASGITTLLNTLVQFACLPVLFAVLCAVIFRRAPHYTPILITVLHVVTYAVFLLVAPAYPTNGEPVHYLYFAFIQFVVEFVICWFLNKYKGTPEEWKPSTTFSSHDIEMTPWKYRWVGCGVTIALLVFAYVLFSPVTLGI
ncbi:solute:sodium symporter family transporter [Butyricicoccus sp. 1XD8-22]|nr:solute:sodium symporter family transporter [Butyricicoccus sp. 1XD8-22]